MTKRRTYPNTLALAIKEIREIERTLEIEQNGVRDVMAQRDQARLEARGATADAKVARDQFADLKKRLWQQEKENTRLRGYLMRVHEGDVERSGTVEVKSPDGGVYRHPAVDRSQVLAQHDLDFGGVHSLNRQNEKHWTSY